MPKQVTDMKLNIREMESQMVNMVLSNREVLELIKLESVERNDNIKN